MPIAFDGETLETLGIVSYGDTLKGQLTTAHPHYDQDTQFNYLLNFGRKSTYNVYTLPDGSSERRLLGSYETDKPWYMHSFGLSQKYVVLMEFPLVVNPLSMLLRGKPFIANYAWEPKRGTRFSLVDRQTGEVSHAHTDEAWFGFHHVNSADREGKVDFDMIVYPDADVVQYFYLNSLLSSPNDEAYPQNELRRFTIDVSAGTVSSRRLADYTSELPRINYGRCNGQAYRYAYAAGIAKRSESVIFDTIVKFDLAGDIRQWKQEGHYPGEPVFVARPDAQSEAQPENEDDGILLTVVLDAPANNSYLLLLDARDLSEIARNCSPACAIWLSRRLYSFVATWLVASWLAPYCATLGKQICKTSLQKLEREARANRSSSFWFLTERRFSMAASMSRQARVGWGPSPVPRVRSSRS